MSDSLTWADVEKAYKMLKSMPPAPVRIWFIDRPAEYNKMIRVFYSVGVSQIDTLTGLPIIDWRTSDFDPEAGIIASKNDNLAKLMVDNYPDKRVYPWICAQPGIWVEWNNGNFTELTNE